MPSRDGPVHVATIKKQGKGRTYVTHLLRRTYREGNSVKHETLGNISHLPDDLVETIRKRLSGEQAPAGPWEIERSLPHGHVALVLGVLRDIGLDTLIASKPCRERDLCLAMIVSRIINPCSKLACNRSLNLETATNSLGLELELGKVRNNELYGTLDWLLERQIRIENKLAKKHLEDSTLLLYDISSSYYTGEVGGLVQFGHSRDQKSGHPQIVYGLLCNSAGIPVSIEVFSGNTADPSTVKSQIEKVQKRFGIKRVVMVGDRGMLTSKRIDEELREIEGLDWISALRNDAIKKLVEQEAFAPSLFDQTDLAEISSPDYPGERLVVCRNPLLAERRRQTRMELLARTETELEKIVVATQRPKRALRGKDRIGIRVGRVLEKCGMGKHFIVTIKEDSFTYQRNAPKIEAESALDGIYIVRTSLDEKEMGASEAVLAYKNLARVERAFRSLKQIDLMVRPIYHRIDDRIRAHVFLCMLAYYVEWHLRQRIKPVLFEDEERESVESERESVVAPAPRSEMAKAKESSKRSEDNWPIHSFQTLLEDLGTLCRNLARVAGENSNGTFTIKTKPTAFQSHVFQLAQIEV